MNLAEIAEKLEMLKNAFTLLENVDKLEDFLGLLDESQRDELYNHKLFDGKEGFAILTHLLP